MNVETAWFQLENMRFLLLWMCVLKNLSSNQILEPYLLLMGSSVTYTGIIPQLFSHYI